MRTTWILPLVPAFFLSCAGKQAAPDPAPAWALAGTEGIPAGVSGGYSGAAEELEDLAELERSGGFVPGLGLAESNIREKAADHAGAVLAVFKELSWAYSLGSAGVTREAIREGLKRLLDSASFTGTAGEQIAAAVPAALAFFDGRWEEAEGLLRSLYGDAGDDVYSRWMILVCQMEKSGGQEGRAAYAAIRSRYASFPEYWYRAARANRAARASRTARTSRTERPDGGGAEFAERCVNLAPAGPYAAECRIMLAESLGLESADAPVLRTRQEIENAVSAASSEGNPQLLEPLLPLAALPDNPSTLYATGAMRALASRTLFREWFNREAEKAQGRLAERLRYIVRG